MKQGVDDVVVEEIVQDVMVILWCKVDLFDLFKLFVSIWLFWIVRNCCIDWLWCQKMVELDLDDLFLQLMLLLDVVDEMDVCLCEECVCVVMVVLLDE